MYTCTRCNGTGSYSFNPMYGTVCFKCWGSGKQATAPKPPKASEFTGLSADALAELNAKREAAVKHLQQNPQLMAGIQSGFAKGIMNYANEDTYAQSYLRVEALKMVERAG